MASIDTVWSIFNQIWNFETFVLLIGKWNIEPENVLKIKPSGSDKFSQQATDCAFESWVKSK